MRATTMRRLSFLLLLLAAFAALVAARAATSTVNLIVTVTAMPGPNAALFASPYYSCLHNFYFSTTGTDGNAGTRASPWAFPGNGTHLTGRSAGDCLNLANGTYTTSDVILALATGQGSSVPSGYLVVRPDAGNGGSATMDGVIIKAPTSRTDNSLMELTTAYIILDGLEIDGSHPDDADTVTGVFNSCVDFEDFEHMKVVNSKIHNCAASGVKNENTSNGIVGSGDFFEVAYNEIYQNSQIAGAGTCESGVNFYIPHVATDNNNDDNNATITPFRVWIHHNKVHHNHNLTTCTDGNGIIVDNTGNGTNGGSGVPYTKPIGIKWNWIYHNGGRGIALTVSPLITVDHNSTYDNGQTATQNASCPSGELSYQGSTGTGFDTTNSPTITNNAFYNPPGSDTTGSCTNQCVWWDTTGVWTKSQFTNNATWMGTAASSHPSAQDCIDTATDNSTDVTFSANQIGVNPGFVSVTPGSENLCIAPGSAIASLGIGAC